MKILKPLGIKDRKSYAEQIKVLLGLLRALDDGRLDPAKFLDDPSVTLGRARENLYQGIERIADALVEPQEA